MNGAYLCSKVLRVYQQGLNSFAHILSNTNSLEKFLRIHYKTLKCYSKIKPPSPGITHLSLHLRTSLEVLSSIQTFTLIQQISCPNREGQYLFKRASWQSCASKVFLLFYSILSKIRLAAKLKFINQKRLNKATLGHLPVFKLITSIFYLLSCVCLAGEGWRIKNRFKTITSTGKMVITTFTLLIEAFSIQKTVYVLILTGASCALDVVCLAKQENFL